MGGEAGRVRLGGGTFPSWCPTPTKRLLEETVREATSADPSGSRSSATFAPCRFHGGCQCFTSSVHNMDVSVCDLALRG